MLVHHKNRCGRILSQVLAEEKFLEQLQAGGSDLGAERRLDGRELSPASSQALGV